MSEPVEVVSESSAIQLTAVDFSGTKKTPLKTTIAIPSSLFQTKKLVDEKARQNKEASDIKIQEQEEVVPSGTSVPLTQELFDLHIDSIRDHYKKADKNFELAILDQGIKVRPGGEVILEVVGHMQEEIAGKMKPELVGLIRQFTNSDRVLILVEVKEEVETGAPKLYTSTDKLNYLREKHPALAELQRMFGLETDF